VALGKSAKVIWVDIFYAPRVYFAVSDVSGFDEFFQPRCCGWVDLVVVGAHQYNLVLPQRKQKFPARAG
jgi:hypothetical protein